MIQNISNVNFSSPTTQSRPAFFGSKQQQVDFGIAAQMSPQTSYPKLFPNFNQPEVVYPQPTYPTNPTIGNLGYHGQTTGMSPSLNINNIPRNMFYGQTQDYPQYVTPFSPKDGQPHAASHHTALQSNVHSLGAPERHALFGHDEQDRPLSTNYRSNVGTSPQPLGQGQRRVISPAHSPERQVQSYSRLIDEARITSSYESPQNFQTKNPEDKNKNISHEEKRSALLKYVTGNSSNSFGNKADPVSKNSNFINMGFSPQSLKSHHGKSLRSIQLFGREESHAYPHVTHNQKNPLVKAVSLESEDFNFSPLELDIHEDSCYNLLNKKRYEKSYQRTPLEDFFLKESIAQFKVAQYLANNHVLSPPNIKLPSITRKHKYMLVLDIDETLVHSELVMEQSVKKVEYEGKTHDRYIEFPNPNGTSDVYGVRFRPFMMEFIERMNKIYDLAVYTASARDYADSVIDQLDPLNNIFVARLYRDHCLPVNNMNIKNMASFDGNDAYLVDNLIYSFAFHINQGIPICPFVDDPLDVELRDLATILEQVCKFESMDSLLQDLMGLNDFYENLELSAQDPAVEISPTVLLENHFNKNQQVVRTAGGNTISLQKV